MDYLLKDGLKVFIILVRLKSDIRIRWSLGIDFVKNIFKAYREVRCQQWFLIFQSSIHIEKIIVGK